MDIDGYFAGEGTINNIRHIRFQVKRNNEISNTIDVTSRFYSIDYTDAAEVKDTASAFMNGKVKAYVRTYKKDKDIKTHYYYVLYINRDKLKDCGELE